MKRVLFVCVENSCRSQMAAGIAKALGKELIEVYSAGSRPGAGVNPIAIEVMKEAGIDIANNRPKGFAELPVQRFDYVITLGCQDICPFFPADQHIEWNIEDPKGKDINFFRQTRDSIMGQVKRLIQDICAKS